jgi:hypothetical protein
MTGSTGTLVAIILHKDVGAATQTISPGSQNTGKATSRRRGPEILCWHACFAVDLWDKINFAASGGFAKVFCVRLCMCACYCIGRS